MLDFPERGGYGNAMIRGKEFDLGLIFSFDHRIASCASANILDAARVSSDCSVPFIEVSHD